MTLQDWHDSGKYFKFQNYSVFYQTAGQGEILVLIHGFPTSSWDWIDIWEGLKAGFQVIAPDMLGFGFSDKPRHITYSIHQQADLYEALCEELGLDSIHLLSHDYGDTVAQELIARYNDRQKAGEKGIEIKSLCLLNGGIFPEMHRPRPIQKALNSPLGWLVSLLSNERTFRKSFSAVFGTNTQPTEEQLKDFWATMTFKRGHRLMHKLIKYITDRRIHRDRWVNALIATQVPLRLINGPEDPVSGRHAADRYKALIPNPDVVLLEGIGHYPQTEAPEQVLEAYLAFVGE
jgi:pimeloyl-ACP methyl ester carboxylesterase